MRTICVMCVAVALMPLISLSGTSAESDPMLLTLKPKESIYWLTVMESPYTVPLDYPNGVSSASVTVTDDFGYSRTYSNVSTSTCSVDLPQPADMQGERVYTVTVEYANGQTSSVRIGRICGSSDDDVSSGTRCLKTASTRKWNRIYSTAVLQVPFGASSVYVDGNAVDTGLDGACGWFQVGPVGIGEVCTVQIASGSPVTLTGAGIGMNIIIK